MCRLTAYRNFVVVGSGIDACMSGDRLDLDLVITITGADVRRAFVCGLDRKGIVTRSKPDVQNFKVTIDNTARQSPTANNRFATHT